MAHRPSTKTTFEPRKVIQPFYTGGSVALSQDGRLLATCLGEDALLTDLKTGVELARIEGDGEAITTLSITPSASYLITCSRSLSMRIYSLRPTDSKTIDVDLARTLRSHSSPVVVSAVDQTGTLLATGGADGVVKVWDIRGGYVTHTFHGHSGVISALHFFQVDASTLPVEQPSKQRKKKRKQGETEEQEQYQEETTLGYRLASGGEDGKVRIWNLHKRASAAVLDSHVSVVRSLDYSPQENVLASGSRDKTVMLWDARTWKTRSTIPVLEGVESTGFIKNGAVLYTGGENGRLRLWTVSGGRELTQEQDIGAETDAIMDVINYSSLPFLLSIHADQTLALHSVTSLDGLLPNDQIQPLPILRRISGTHDEVIDLAYVGTDHSMLALATNLEDVRIISLESSTELSGDEQLGGKYFGADVTQLKGHDDIIICMDVDWSGHWLATGAKDNTARLWRIDPANNSYECYATFTGHAESLGAIALSHSTPQVGSATSKNPLDHPPHFLITGSQDKTIKRWDTSTVLSATKKASRAAYTRKAHDKDINALDTNDKSTLFASASQDRTVKIWSLEEGEAQGVLRGHKRGVWSVKFAPTNTSVNITGSSGPASTSRGLVLTGSGDKTVKVWSLTDYSCLLTLEGHTNSVLKVIWLPNPLTTPDDAPSSRNNRDVQVASAGGDGLVKIWDVGTGEAACTLDNHTDRVWALAVNPSPSKDSTGATLVSGGGDGVLSFWTDTTALTASAAAATETKRVEADQRLQNLVFAGNYREAITLALALNQPARLLSLFKSVVEGETQEKGSLTGSLAVDEVVASLADEQIYKLLLRVRDWNTNARTAGVAQRVLNAIVKSYPASRFVELKISGAGEVGNREGAKEKRANMKEVLDALKAYTERHYRRMEEMVDESYLLEFTLREMDEVAGVDVVNGTNGVNRLKHGSDLVILE